MFLHNDKELFHEVIVSAAEDCNSSPFHKNWNAYRPAVVFSSGVSINVCGQKYARGVKRFKIAEAAKITFKGGKTVTIEDKDWTFSEGDDGKSLYLTCATHGMLLLVR